MTRQRLLVRIYHTDRMIHDPGEIMEREGLDWKWEPLDPAERAEWAEKYRDQARVDGENVKIFRTEPLREA